MGEVVLAFFSGLVRRVLGPELEVWVGRPESRLRFFSFSFSSPFPSLGPGLVGGSIFPVGAFPSISLFLFFFLFFIFVLSGDGTATISLSSSNKVASSGFTSSLTFSLPLTIALPDKFDLPGPSWRAARAASVEGPASPCCVLGVELTRALSATRSRSARSSSRLW